MCFRKVSLVGLVALCVSAVSLPAAASDLRLEIRDGKITLIAHDVPAAQILTEWGRVGQTKIINADKLPVGMLTLELQDVPEAKALDIVLRSVSGYFARPRTDLAAGGSLFDRIIIMPPSTAVAGLPGPRPGAMPVSPPTFRPPGFPGNEAPGDQDPPVPQPNMPNMGVGMGIPLTPGMPGYVPPPNMAPSGTIPPYPGAPLNLPAGQGQPSAQPPNPWGVTVPGSATPGVISPMPQPTPPGINPLIPRRPGG